MLGAPFFCDVQLIRFRNGNLFRTIFFIQWPGIPHRFLFNPSVSQCFKTSICARPFVWRWVCLHILHANEPAMENIFIWMVFGTEVNSNSKMIYCVYLDCCANDACRKKLRSLEKGRQTNSLLLLCLCRYKLGKDFSSRWKSPCMEDILFFIRSSLLSNW